MNGQLRAPRALRSLADWFRSHPLTSGFLALVVFAVGAHLFANWRAEVRWQRYCTEARARGVKLTLAEFVPPEIPDAENFAALPMFKAIFQPGAKDPMRLPDASGAKPTFGARHKGESFDWLKWQTYFKDAGFIAETTDSPPRDVLRALEHYAPQFKEWSEWRTRPRCRFPLDFNAGFAMSLPHLGMFSNAAKLFSLRLRSHLALGDPGAAYADFREGLQSYRALSDEPTFIAGLVQISALATLKDAVGSGLQDHAWSDAELQKIDADLAAVRLWQDYRRAFASERGFGNWMYDTLADSSPIGRRRLMAGIPVGFGGSPSAFEVACGLVPKRVFRDNQLRHNQFFDELMSRVDPEGVRFFPDTPAPSSPENFKGVVEPYYFFLFRMASPVYSAVEENFVRLQTQLDQTRIAIALERFRLARGAYPETLAELVAEFMAEVPLETYSRQPMSYRRKEGGTIHLYGWGKNRKDDGGVVDPKIWEKSQRDEIWLYAPPAR
ncbi:MAG: hypothetical protein K8R23_08835 [Chthoniobacter sp.]|nr:hypothetical protein [Chthoniobacter sp.]